jgi:hypothetical protein
LKRRGAAFGRGANPSVNGSVNGFANFVVVTPKTGSDMDSFSGSSRNLVGGVDFCCEFDF